MKKLQNYILRPELIKRKNEKTSFKNDFIQWNKNNLHVSKDSMNSLTKNNRSKSNNDNNKIFQSNLKKYYVFSQSKQNIKNANNMKASSVVKKKNSETLKNDCRNISKSTSSYNKNNINNQPLYKKVNSYHYKSLDSKLNSYNHQIIHKHSRSTANMNDFMKRQKASSSLSSKPRIKSAQNSVNQLFQEKQIKDLKQKEKNNIKFTYSYRTKQGVLITNPNKTNQDSLLIKTKLLNKNFHLFAVADGHGTFGHLVSQAIAKNMAKITQQYLSLKKNSHQILSKVFNDLQNIVTNSNINALYSGSTLVSILIQQNILTCANVGDSRAILARQIDRKSWEMIHLSQDHKPSLQNQKKRILKNGGRVYALKDQKGNPVGPLRVWLPNQNAQGLAMSRSIGDNISKSVGVIHNPQLIQIDLQKRDKFILIASDGIWQFISNQQVLQLIVPYYRQNKLQQACDSLLKLAYERWTVQDTSVIDDITFILIFLIA